MSVIDNFKANSGKLFAFFCQQQLVIPKIKVQQFLCGKNNISPEISNPNPIHI